ncbi:hypothetical protein DVB37_20925 [Achromobacter sp. B7]|uniref:hypothetical protein n=1 Tax=Achromobacter sp. B7 TaxID=2282475 RepID=UPI000E7162F8|nr:hypothetical protein [Achromobacter sp. B7]AYD66115.1 hypothetical protein DVB37_20925 [Achromobacter sp. B7]
MSELQFFDRVLARLRAVPYTDLKTVADATHVSLSNLRKIRYGEVKNPGVQTVQALDDYFARIDGTGGHPCPIPESLRSPDPTVKKS